MAFRDYLKGLIESRGTNAQQLSYKAKVPAAHLSRILNAERGTPKPGLLRALAAALDVDYIEMLVQAGYVNPETDLKAASVAQAALDKASAEFVALRERAKAAGMNDDDLKNLIEMSIAIAERKNRP